MFGVIGMDGDISEEVRKIAEETGKEIAKKESNSGMWR